MKNNHKKKRLIFVGFAFAISGLALCFIISNFRNNIVFFYSPSEIKDEIKGEVKQSEILHKISNKVIRVGGLVVEGSVKKIDALNTEFVITDTQEELKIQYRGVVPDLFRDKQGVVAKGKFDMQKNEFFSSELLIKHDEKYMPPEVARSIKN